MRVKHKLNLALCGICILVSAFLYVLLKTAYVTGKAQELSEAQEQLQGARLQDSIDSIAQQPFINHSEIKTK